jgi:hypothetical protein
MRSRTVLGRTAGLVAMVAAVVLTFGLGTAFAVPTAPTMSLPALQAKIDAAIASDPNAVLPGYMETVVRGSHIEDIPVNVIDVNYDSTGDLILFQATGDEIASYGGIVAGMSGSPVFIYDTDGVDKLVGAVSYGDYFTLGGTGLATPIDLMSQIEADHPLSTLGSTSHTALSAQSGPAGSVTITPDARVSALLGGRRTIVAKPLSSIQVGGMSASDPVYKAFSARMAARGITVLSASPRTAGTMSAAVDRSSFTTTLTGGASVAAMYARGNFWMGDVGTVTYATTDTVLAFGHPADDTGVSGLDMSNAYVDGVWSDQEQPYKVVEPGALRGTIVQDRDNGIMGAIGVMPSEAPVTVRVTDTDNSRVASSTTWIPSYVIDSPDYNYDGIAPMAAYVGAGALYDSGDEAGSGVATTTVVVSDGTNDYTIVRSNVFDSAGDLPATLVGDIADIVYSFQDVNGNGLAHADILSVDLQAKVTSTRNRADVADVTAPNGLKWGPNHIVVTVDPWAGATQTIDATINIPAGALLPGTLDVSAADASGIDSSNPTTATLIQDISEMFGPGNDDSTVDRRTVKEVVDELSADQQPNNQLVVTYMPGEMNSGSDSGSSDYSDSMYGATLKSADVLTDPATSTIDSSWYFSGEVAKVSTQLTAMASAHAVAYNGSVRIIGTIEGLQDSGTIVVSGVPDGSTTSTVLAHATVVPDPDIDAFGEFATTVKGLKKNTTLTVKFADTDANLQSQQVLHVNVAASVALKSSASSIKKGGKVTLTATVLPADAGGKVVFEYLKSGHWTAVGAQRTVGSNGLATATWAVPKGKWSVRARFTGGVANTAATSALKTITGK